MGSPFNPRKRYVLLKAESTPGTAEADMATGTVALELYDITFDDQMQRMQDEFASGGYTRNPDIIGQMMGTITCKHNVVLEKVHTGGIPCSILMSGLTASGSKDYSDDPTKDMTGPTFTAWFIYPSSGDGYKIVAKLKGCKSDWELGAEKGQCAVLSSKITGALYDWKPIADNLVPLFTAPTDVTKPPVFRGGTTQTIDDVQVRISGFTLKMALTLVPLEDAADATFIKYMAVDVSKPVIQLKTEAKLNGSNVEPILDNFMNPEGVAIELNFADVPLDEGYTGRLQITADKAMNSKLKGSDSAPLIWDSPWDLLTDDPTDPRLVVSMVPTDLSP